MKNFRKLQHSFELYITSNTMSLHSTFKFWAFFPIALLLPATGLLVTVATRSLNQPNVPLIVYICLGFFIFIWVYLVFGELRTKVIKIEINNVQITVSNFLGLGARRHYTLAQFEGFETALLPAAYGTYEYLYLIENGKKVVKLSQFYHRNYTDLKSDLKSKMKNLGQKEFSFFQEIKEIFV